MMLVHSSRISRKTFIGPEIFLMRPGNEAQAEK